jgi:hypothetical protein
MTSTQQTIEAKMDRKRGEAWEAAQAAWDDYEAHRARNAAARNAGKTRRSRVKSPTGGLGERARIERASMGVLTIAQIAKAQSTRLAKQTRLKDQEAKAWTANRVAYQRPADESRYFPHQSIRECARRVRQMAAAGGVL